MKHVSTKEMVTRLYEIKTELTLWEQEFVSTLFLRVEYKTLTSATDNQIECLEGIFRKHFSRG